MRKSDEKMAPLFQQVNQLQNVIAAQGNILAAEHPHDPLSSVKRKHETISNEGLKKQYEPLEEMQIRVDAISEALAKATEENMTISPDEALQLQKTLDEGKIFTSRRLPFFEVAHVEGWNVAKCMEKNSFLSGFGRGHAEATQEGQKRCKGLGSRKEGEEVQQQ
jgi:hypothetical protein